VDQEARFLELLQSGSRRWHGIARAYAGPDAEDLFQEILLQVWRALPTFRGESSLGTWSYRIALNIALCWRRDEQTRRRRLPIQAGFDAARLAAPAFSAGSSGLLDLLLSELPPADKAVLLLYLDDVGYEEMSQVLGASPGALRVRMHRIKERLAKLHQGQFHES
jgi:RNA polymerase sigma-70 factor (ECF subfamily)